MTSRTSVINAIVPLTGVNKHYFDRIGVRLSEAGLIASGGRGKYAPEMLAGDQANLLLALMGSYKNSQAANAVQTFSELRSKANPNKTFHRALVEILENPEKADEVLKVTLCRNFPEATIYYTDWSENSETGYCNVIKEEDFISENSETRPGMRVEIILDGGVLRTLSTELETIIINQGIVHGK